MADSEEEEQMPDAAYNVSRPKLRMTYSHLMGITDESKQIASGITPMQNIGRTFSPASTICSLGEFENFLIREAAEPTIVDLVDQSQGSVKSYAGFESSTELGTRLKQEIVGIGEEWDEKLAEEGYGQDVVSEESVSTSDERSKSRSTARDNSILPDVMTLASSSIFQEVEKPMSFSVIGSGGSESTTSSKRKSSDQIRDTTTTDITEMYTASTPDTNLKRTSGSSNSELGESDMDYIIKRTTHTEPRLSDNLLEFLKTSAGEKFRRSQMIDWNEALKSRRESFRIARELGLEELMEAMVLKEVTLMCCCVKNGDGTKNLDISGPILLERIGRRLEDNDLEILFEFIQENKDIVYLDLSYNRITSDGFHEITKFLSTNATLTGINLMCNDILDIVSKDITDISKNGTLRSLRINGNAIGRKAGEFLSFIIIYKQLEHLDVSQTDQTILTVPWLVQAILQSELKCVDISRILGFPFYGEDTKHLASLFGDLLKMSFTLVELHLQKNSLGDHDMEQLMNSFWKNRTLELLDLSCNKISDYGAAIIADNLNYGAPLKALMLSHNRIRDAGARSLSFKLPFSQIKLLDLSFNKISEKGVLDIVYTIKKPYQLMALFIFGNEINEKTCRSILKQIESGNLIEHSLDIKISNAENMLQSGYNPSADRYRNRYYKVGRYGFPQIYSLKKEKEIECTSENCLNYMYHNVVNPISNELKSEVTKRDL